MNIHAGTLTRSKPPFRAEHIGSLLRPAALLEQRDALRARRDFARRSDRGGECSDFRCGGSAGAARPAFRDRWRVPPPLLSQLFLSAAWRSQHRHRRGRRREGCAGRRRARRAAGGRRSKAACVGPIRSMSTISISSKTKRRCCPRSRFRAPARCISAAAMRRCSRTPIATSISSGTTRSKPSARSLNALGAGRLPLCADRRNRVRQVRRSGRAGDFGGARRRLERTDRHLHRDDQPRAARCAEDLTHRHASVPGQSRRALACRRQLRGGRRAAVQCARNSVLFPRIRHRRAPAISRHCASFPSTSRSCSDWFRPRRRRWKTRQHCARASRMPARHVSLDRLAVSPQCGFASVDTGNPVTPAGAGS